MRLTGRSGALPAIAILLAAEAATLAPASARPAELPPAPHAGPVVVRAGVWYIGEFTGSNAIATILSFAYGDPGDRPLMGDWDGDGTRTPGVFRNGLWFLRNSNTTGIADLVIGSATRATYRSSVTGTVTAPNQWASSGMAPGY